MAIIVKPFTFIPGTIIRSSEVNQDFDIIYTDYNGNITNANISNTAGIAYTKLAALTLGSVPFAGVGGFLTQNNAQFFFDNNTVRLGIGTSAPAYRIDVQANTPGPDWPTIAVRNSNNAGVLGHAMLHAQTGGATAGDPYLMFNVNGLSFWSLGIDNSDNDNFKIAAGNGLGVSDRLTMNAAGEMLLLDINPPTANYANRNSFVKGWVKFNTGVWPGAPFPIAPLTSYNILSVGRASLNTVQVNWNRIFSSGNYPLSAMQNTGGSLTIIAPAAASCQFGNTADNRDIYIIAMGDQ